MELVNLDQMITKTKFEPELHGLLNRFDLNFNDVS